MPWFTLQRNYALSTTKGHSINFKKGVKTWVPPICVPEVVAIGAVSDEPIDVLGAEKEPAPALTQAKREEIVFAAFEKLLLRGARGDFQASGTPHPKKVEEITGFEMGDKERQAMWEKYNLKKSEEANQ